MIADPGGERAATLMADLERLAAARCPGCGAPVCGHQLLFAFALGFKDAPRCAACLAAGLAWEAADFRAHLREYIAGRECYLAAWRWTGAREGACPMATGFEIAAAASTPPAPPPSPAPAPAPLPTEDAAWDAGDLGCGDLVLELRSRLIDLAPGSVLRLVARDPGAPADIPAWCGMTRHTLLHALPPTYWIRRRSD